MIVIVDADTIIGQTDPADALHTKVSEIFERLAKTNTRLLYPVTAVAEANAYIQRVSKGTATAHDTIKLLVSESELVEINGNTVKNALKYFSPTTSKKNTLFDCIVAAIAEEKQADAIFSFDKFYRKKGFKLASEL